MKNYIPKPVLNKWADIILNDSLHGIKPTDIVMIKGEAIAYHGKGVAPMLLAEFERVVNGSLIMSSIMREPLCNLRFKNFFLKNGYEHAGTFYKGAFGGFPVSNSFVVIKDLRCLSTFCEKTERYF